MSRPYREDESTIVTLIIPEGTSPNSEQTMYDSEFPQWSPHTEFHFPSIHNSTLPSVLSLPPTSRISPVLQSTVMKESTVTTGTLTQQGTLTYCLEQGKC